MSNMLTSTSEVCEYNVSPKKSTKNEEEFVDMEISTSEHNKKIVVNKLVETMLFAIKINRD